MTTKGLELIKRNEGCRLKAYKCPAGVWTIGYGHTKDVKAGMTISQAEAEQMLKQDLKTYETKVKMLLKVALKDDQISALVSLAYNIGIGALAGSTVLHRINSKASTDKIAEAWKWWNKGGGKVLPGLVKRRNEEVELYVAE